MSLVSLLTAFVFKSVCVCVYVCVCVSVWRNRNSPDLIYPLVTRLQQTPCSPPNRQTSPARKLEHFLQVLSLSGHLLIATLHPSCQKNEVKKKSSRLPSQSVSNSKLRVYVCFSSVHGSPYLSELLPCARWLSPTLSLRLILVCSKLQQWPVTQSLRFPFDPTMEFHSH